MSQAEENVEINTVRNLAVRVTKDAARQIRGGHPWVFNNQPCTLQEFADHIWPNEHEDKMLFILTHSGPKTE